MCENDLSNLVINDLKFIDCLWFSQLPNTKIIGLIKCEDIKTKEIKKYIGVGDGFDEIEDIKLIMKFGTPFNIGDF